MGDNNSSFWFTFDEPYYSTGTTTAATLSTASSWSSDGYYACKAEPVATVEVGEDGSLYYNFGGTKYQLRQAGLEQVTVQEKPKIKEIVLEEVDISFEL